MSFHPTDDVKSIVGSLVDNMDKFQDWDNPLIPTSRHLRSMESEIEVHVDGGSEGPMKIAVIGADGQLGNDVVAAFSENGDEVVPLTHADIEMSQHRFGGDSPAGTAPQIIVNTAAMHHVENCEREPEKAFAVNGLGTRKTGSHRASTGRSSDARQHRLRIRWEQREIRTRSGRARP